MNNFDAEWGLDRFKHNYSSEDQDDRSVAGRLVSEFFDWWDTTDDNRYSVIWSFDVHKPYVETADRFDGHPNPAVDPYNNAISYTDRQFARLIDGLRERGDYEKTALIVLGGHGEVFDKHHWMESSRLARLLYDWNVPIFRYLLHEDQLGHVAIPPYETVIEVPMMMKLPGQTDRHDVDVICQTHDLAPTARGLLNVADSPDYWQGYDLTRLVNLGPQKKWSGTMIEEAANQDDQHLKKWREYANVTTNQTPGGSTYRAIRGDARKAVTITDPSWDDETLKFYLGRRFFSKSRQAFELGPEIAEERRTSIYGEFESLFCRLSEHVETNNQLQDRLVDHRWAVTDEKRRQLEEMGYL